jgi:hypothetical protein
MKAATGANRAIGRGNSHYPPAADNGQLQMIRPQPRPAQLLRDIFWRPIFREVEKLSDLVNALLKNDIELIEAAE